MTGIHTYRNAAAEIWDIKGSRSIPHTISRSDDGKQLGVFRTRVGAAIANEKPAGDCYPRKGQNDAMYKE